MQRLYSPLGLLCSPFIAKRCFPQDSFVTSIWKLNEAMKEILKNDRTTTLRNHLSMHLCSRYHHILHSGVDKYGNHSVSALAGPCLLLAIETAFLYDNRGNILTLQHFHWRDLYLRFTEENHRYTLVLNEGGGKFSEVVSVAKKEDDNEELRAIGRGDEAEQDQWGLRSVTGFIHCLFPAFDGVAVAQKMIANKNEWEALESGELPVEQMKRRASYLAKKKSEWLHKYPTVTTIPQLLAEWERVRTEASQLGTKMHANLEYYYSEQEYSTEGREWELFQEFERAHVHGKLLPYRTEWGVYNEGLRMCGQVDIIYRYAGEAGSGRDARGKLHLVMMDWKRSKELKMYNDYGQSGSVPATEEAGDCNYVHYTIQLCLYKYMLEAEYDVVIDAMFLVVLHPSQEHYILEEVVWDRPMMDGIIAHRLEQVRALEK
jgi:hypothetical protein